MTKTIDTLVEDMLAVVDLKGGWDATVSHLFSTQIKDTLETRLTPPTEERKGSLRMSNVGSPCKRKLWYHINDPTGGEVLRPTTRLKFLFGDILEDLLVHLAIAAGHQVEGMQDEMEIEGIKGHRDCVIDGVTVDIKSASSFSFSKFKDGTLRDNDAFGYISQLSSYVYSGKDDPIVTDKKRGAFLVIDKQHANLCLDIHDFSKDIENKREEVVATKALMGLPNPPAKGFDDVADGKSGNRKLATNCSYCEFKDKCWPDLRTYIYSNGPRYLTKVSREPNVMEKQK